MPAQPLLIFPCNGNGLEALDCLGDSYVLQAFIDDAPEKRTASCHGHPVLDRHALRQYPQAHVLAVPGSPTSYALRKDVIRALGVESHRFATLIHPKASISPLATIGKNVLVMAGVVITSNAVIEDHVCVLPNTVIHHDVRVGAWSLIGSNVTVAGGVTIGEGCYIGSGTSLMHGLRIGGGSLMGLGSNVIRDVAAGLRVAGNPARPLG